MLDIPRYFVKEKKGFFKPKGAFEILNPETQQRIAVARNTTSGLGKALGSFLSEDKKAIRISISENEKSPAIVEIKRPWSFLFRPKTHVYYKDKHIGYFMKKRFSIGGGLHIYDEADKYLGEVAGSWKGGKFTFKSEKGKELGVIDKKWSGIGQEMFTSADNYMVSVAEGESAETGALLLSAAIVLDSIYFD